MTQQSADTANPIASLLDVLDLEQLEVNLFRGYSPQVGRKRVYGGQVLAQALVAAARTVAEQRPMHSMHAYFLLGGDPRAPIIYDVERVRDGGSFTTRRVKAIQHGRAIFVMSTSFHKQEVAFDHQQAMPDVPGPEQLPTLAEVLQRLGDRLDGSVRAYLSRERPFDMRLVEFERYMNPTPAPPRQHVWLRSTGPLPDQPHLHQCVLAYASDMTILDTALVAHGRLLVDPELQLASLDHAMWFHRDFRADAWLLYAQDSPSSSGARGLGRGSLFRRDGSLVASVAQEGLMRIRTQRSTA